MKKLIFTLGFILIASIAIGQVYKTVNATPGGLDTLLTSTERVTVTNLTIKGSIDARDFRYMRDEMSSLSVLDISGANIASYTGTDGTDNWSGLSVFYPSKAIPDYALYSSNSLTSVIVNTQVNRINAEAFMNCSNLISVTGTSSVTIIGDKAFSDCYNLSSITGSTVLKTIGASAFSSCNSLSSINIPASVTSIGDGAFFGCGALFIVDPANLYYSSNGGVLFNKTQTTLLQCPSSLRGHYTPPATVTSIGNYAFAFCDSLTSVTIPTSVITIGENAFNYCKSITSIDIPNSVTTIGSYAFAHCDTLLSITIPSSVTSIGNNAFTECINLASVSLPATLTSISSSLFYKCKNLTSIDIPSSVTTIGPYAFYNCTDLTTFSVPLSVGVIGENAFFNCSNLTSFYVSRSVPIDLSSTYSVFYGIDPTCILYVPQNAKSAYVNAYQWKEFSSIVELIPTGKSDAVIDKPQIYTSGDRVWTEDINGPAILRIYNTAGKQLIAKNISGDESISISELANGIYIVQLNVGELSVTRKIVKN
ncbi:MAG: leucine-rich repeat domain-containing protein [Bacteroidota bacterium]|nr:leucine-rich repeat domain-containing protein [Bacteroidota bacterium]